MEDQRCKPVCAGLAYTYRLHTCFVCDTKHRCSCIGWLVVLYKCLAFFTVGTHTGVNICRMTVSVFCVFVEQ